MSSAEISFVYVIKYLYLVNLSTIINIILYSCPIIGSFNFNSLTIKSYNITSYGVALYVNCAAGNNDIQLFYM